MCDAVPWVVDIWYAIVHGHIHFSWDHWDTVYDPKHGHHICINLRWSLECRLSTNRKVTWRIESAISLLLSQSALRNWDFMRTNYIKHSIFRKVCYCFLLHRHHTHSWSDDKNFRASGLRRVLKLLPNLAARAPKRARALQPSQPISSALFLCLSRPLWPDSSLQIWYGNLGPMDRDALWLGICKYMLCILVLAILWLA
jgi:hypothetical protein